MLIGRGKDENSDSLVLLGLEEANVERLISDQPIWKNLDVIDLPFWLLIFYAPNMKVAGRYLRTSLPDVPWLVITGEVQDKPAIIIPLTPTALDSMRQQDLYWPAPKGFPAGRLTFLLSLGRDRDDLCRKHAVISPQRRT